MKPLNRILAVVALALIPSGTFAATCEDALSTLKTTFSGQSTPALLTAVNVLKTAGCNPATERAAMRQASAVLAQRAQARLAADDIAGAEFALANAPALHWAVQAIRGDIAAKKGDRGEAAQMYNAALDTITDPALTPPDARLVPVADRIARLAQENTMLSGNLSASLTRGGQATGVLKSAMRGIVIEKAGTLTNSTDQSQTENGKEPAYNAPKDQYADGAGKESYVVADKVAASVGGIYLPIRFRSGSSELDVAGIHEAETVANFLLINKIHRLTVVGHTDEVGSEAFNLDLSIQRAQTVKHFFQAEGVHATIHILGKGESEPPKLVDYTIYSEEERRRIARRVELVLQE